MARNNLHKKPDSTLLMLTGLFNDVVSPDPATYALTADELTELAEAIASLDSAAQSAATIRGELASAYVAKAKERDRLLGRFTTLVNKIYANPTVTDAMITATGLEPRDAGRSRIVPVRPANLIATPSAIGTVELKWDKNGNAYGVSYHIEVAGKDSSSWTMLTSTTRTSITLSGFEPGVMRWFRVSANKNGTTSRPSFSSVIYPDTPTSSMRLEAA